MKTFFIKLFLSAAVAGTGIMISAQKIDAKSKKILDDVTANYNSKKNSYFKFSFGSGTNGKVTKAQPGIYYIAGNKYKLKIMDTEQIFDGSKIYNINADDMEVTVAKPNATSSMFSPLNYLSTYRKDYNVTYVGSRTVNGILTEHIKLTPVKANGLQYVNLYIDAAKKQMVKLEQYGNNKDVAVISIDDYRENQTLAADMFTFNKNKFKNYIVTEL